MLIFVIAFSFIVSSAANAASQNIEVVKLSSAPTVDGMSGDWEKVKASKIELTGNLGIQSVSVKAGVIGNSVYFLWQWKDDSEDKEHKPYVWDNAAGKYVAGPQREDRFAVNFAMEGDFTHDWMSGKTFKADMWHWKAARTNPIGLAHDKMTIITTEKVKKAYQTTAKNNKIIYIKRPGDKGSKLYSTKRYPVKEKKVMPKYYLKKNPRGSVADVKAKGVWENGTWTLEESRLLNTGYDDDVVFRPGSSVASAIAVFDHTGDDKHNISETIYFKFPR